MQDIIIEESQNHGMKAFFIHTFLLIGSLILAVLGIFYHVGVYKIFGSVGGCIFVAGFIYTIKQVFRTKTLLRITIDGIEDHSMFGEQLYISFNDIKKIEVVNIYGRKMIGIFPRNAEEFIAKLPHARKRIAVANLKMNLPPIAIRVDRARDITIEDIFTLLQKRYSDYNCLYD